MLYRRTHWQSKWHCQVRSMASAIRGRLGPATIASRELPGLCTVGRWGPGCCRARGGLDRAQGAVGAARGKRCAARAAVLATGRARRGLPPPAGWRFPSKPTGGGPAHRALPASNRGRFELRLACATLRIAIPGGRGTRHARRGTARRRGGVVRRRTAVGRQNCEFPKSKPQWGNLRKVGPCIAALGSRAKQVQPEHEPGGQNEIGARNQPWHEGIGQW